MDMNNFIDLFQRQDYAYRALEPSKTGSQLMRRSVYSRPTTYLAWNLTDMHPCHPSIHPFVTKPYRYGRYIPILWPFPLSSTLAYTFNAHRRRITERKKRHSRILRGKTMAQPRAKTDHQRKEPTFPRIRRHSNPDTISLPVSSPRDPRGYLRFPASVELLLMPRSVSCIPIRVH